MKRCLRIALGALLAPLVYVVVLQYPYTPFVFEKWLAVNAIYAYIAFFVLGGISLSLLFLNGGRPRLRDSCVVMFCVAFSITLLFTLASWSAATSLTVGNTVLVETGRITVEGYLRSALSTLLVGGVSSIAMAVFWLIAFRETHG